MKLADVDKLVENINDAWALALTQGGIPLMVVADCRKTVEDAIVNNAMLECESNT